MSTHTNIDQNTQNEINHAIFNQLQTDKNCPQDLWKAALVALDECGYEVVDKEQD